MGDADKSQSGSKFENRLDSWKEIAAYLDRDVSTVKRWEKQEGLPVHRHFHKSQGRVYSFPSEIDSWLANRSRSPAIASSNRNGVWRLAAGAALLGVSLFSIYVWFGQTPAVSSDPDPVPKLRVLVADFDNLSGFELFDHTLHYAVSAALGESGMVLVVSRQSVGDVLAAMKLPQDTAIDSALAQQIALRDGEIDAVISGRVVRLEESYRLTATLLNLAQGSIDDSTSFEVGIDQPSDLLSRVDHLTDWIQQSLTGKIDRSSSTKLESATTPDLEALHFYSKAMQFCYRDEWGPAEPLLRRAVEKDPEFASAHILLAWVLRNQIPLVERPWRLNDYIGPAKRAFELADSVSEPERLWIQASYYRFKGQLQKSANLYHALLSLRPDHYWAMNNLATHYRSHVRHGNDPALLRRAFEFEQRRADLRRQSLLHNFQAAYRLGLVYSSLEAAESYRRRALNLLSDEPRGEELYASLLLNLTPDFARLLDGEAYSALEALERRAFDSSSAVQPWLSEFFLSLGQLAEVRRLNRLETDQRYRNWSRAMLAYAAGDEKGFREGMRRYWERHSQFNGPLEPIMLARAGLIEEARSLLEAVGPHTPLSATADLMDAARGVVALLGGDESRGAELLEQALSCPAVYGSFLVGAEILAESHESKGRHREALRVLERAHSRTQATILLGHLYGRIQIQLLKLLRSMGKTQQAKELEEAMRRRWAVADPDHPVRAVLDGAENAR